MNLEPKSNPSPEAVAIGKALDHVRIAIKACERAGKALEEARYFPIEVDVRCAGAKLRTVFDALILEYQKV